MCLIKTCMHGGRGGRSFACWDPFGEGTFLNLGGFLIKLGWVFPILLFLFFIFYHVGFWHLLKIVGGFVLYFFYVGGFMFCYFFLDLSIW